MDMSNTRRVVLLGKSGVGKSSLANTILGEAKFPIDHVNDLKTHPSQAETKSVNGSSVTLIDTPGFFDSGRSEEEMTPEIVRCITECAPGPHAFLIVLKVEKFTEQEQDVINKICQYFSEDALKYAVIVFTHGDQLPEGMKIEKFVHENKCLSDLVMKCGGRCHVVDNKYWRNQQDEYRSNQVQVAELLNTVEKMIDANRGGCYTNEMLQEIEKEIQKEEKHIRESSGNDVSQEAIRKQAKSNILKKREDKAPRTWLRGLVGFVIVGLLAIASAVFFNSKFAKVSSEAPLESVATSVTEVVEVVIPEAPPTMSPPATDIGQQVEGATPPVTIIQKTFEVILEKLNTLYEFAYNPWNPFE